MKKTFLRLIVILLAICSLSAQQPAQQTPAQIVELWFRYYSQLDGTDESTNRFLSLYAPDATHQVGPSARQIGPVYYEGEAAIRKMATDVGTKYSDLAYRIEYASANEKSVQLYYTTE